MLDKYLEIASTPSVRAARQRYDGADRYAAPDGAATAEPPVNDRLGEREAAFIATRDGFYIASVSETGWPYVQYRGGPAGFLRVLDERTLGYADFRGNRQYITTGNVDRNSRVSLFLMDYANRRRLKVFGHIEIAEAAESPNLVALVAVPGYRAKIERAVLIRVAAYSWNCPQHITPRFTEAELDEALAPVRDELARLRAENEALRMQLAATPPT